MHVVWTRTIQDWHFKDGSFFQYHLKWPPGKTVRTLRRETRRKLGVLLYFPIAEWPQKALDVSTNLFARKSFTYLSMVCTTRHYGQHGELWIYMFGINSSSEFHQLRDALLGCVTGHPERHGDCTYGAPRVMSASGM